MLTSAPYETGTFRKKVNVLFERMSSSDHVWYKQQKVFAEAYLQSYITKYKLDPYAYLEDLASKEYEEEIDMQALFDHAGAKIRDNIDNNEATNEEEIN